MLTTGIFTTHKVTIPLKGAQKPVYILPFGDIHYGAPLHATDAFDAWCADAKALMKAHDVYFLGMGDYIDIGSTSERVILTSKMLHDSTISALEGVYTFHAEALYQKIAFMEGHILGMIGGNHFGQFEDGTTTDVRLCQRLKCKFLGASVFMRLAITLGKTSMKSLDLWAHHGRGAARLIGGSLNRVQQMGEAAQADIYLMGHDHKKSAGVTSKLMLDKHMQVVARKQIYCRTGGFLRGFVDGKVSYIADMALSPCDLGGVKIGISARRSKAGGAGDKMSVDLTATV